MSFWDYFGIFFEIILGSTLDDVGFNVGFNLGLFWDHVGINLG